MKPKKSLEDRFDDWLHRHPIIHAMTDLTTLSLVALAFIISLLALCAEQK